MSGASVISIVNTRAIFRTLLSFGRSTDGVVALVFGLGAPVLLGVVGVAVDYSRWSQQVQRLQLAADAAAIAGAKELSVSSGNEERIEAVARGIVQAQVPPAAGQSEVSVAATIDRNRGTVRVVVRQQKDAIMSRLVTPALTDMEVSSTALRSGNRKLCALGLDPTSEGTIRLQSTSTITAQKCDIQSNSTSTSGITNLANTTVTAVLACSVGGFSGGGRVSGQRLSDCPVMSDPLGDRQPPSVGACKVNNVPILDLLPIVPRILTPGTYCGGLHIGGASIVIFTPGIYVIKDGPLIIDTTAVVTGNYAGFYFTGTVPDSVVFRASPLSIVNLTAPRDGPMAGILFFEDRAAPPLRSFEILSTTARTLLGTLYMPRGRFVVNSNAILADQSAYTVIIARQLDLDGNPTLVLNANYSDTDVPVPPGIRSSNESVRLIN
jgi:Flp pilus assembly protein TadG